VEVDIRFLAGVLVIGLILFSSLKITGQYERAVAFRFGKLLGEKDPRFCPDRRGLPRRGGLSQRRGGI
jgi:regulator of protease activity HflC (stomatin/prohibitin superfamily)